MSDNVKTEKVENKSKKNKIKVILDFIKIKRLPVVWEIARSYSYIDKECQEGMINIENLIAYTKQVAKLRN